MAGVVVAAAVPLTLAVVFVVALQLWRRQALLSILGGTAFYALLVNLIWPA